MRRRAIIGVVVPAIVLIACGTQAHESRRTAAPSTSTLHQEMVASHQRWAGTTADLRAAQVVRADALNGQFDRCMQAKGYAEFDLRRSVQLPPEPADTGLTGLLEPFGIHRLRERALATARSSAIEYRANHPESEYERWDAEVVAATNECLDASPSADDEQLTALMQPADLDDLLAAWYGSPEVQRALLFDIDTPEAAAYAACLGARGYGDGDLHPEDEFAPTMMSRLRDSVRTPAPADWRVVDDPESRGRSSRWQAFVRAERDWLAADESCRTELVAEHLAAVRELQVEFERRHSELIESVEQGWSDITDRAAALVP